jgi:hypothetical protein
MFLLLLAPFHNQINSINRLIQTADLFLCASNVATGSMRLLGSLSNTFRAVAFTQSRSRVSLALNPLTLFPTSFFFLVLVLVFGFYCTIYFDLMDSTEWHTLAGDDEVYLLGFSQATESGIMTVNDDGTVSVGQSDQPDLSVIEVCMFLCLERFIRITSLHNLIDTIRHLPTNAQTERVDGLCGKRALMCACGGHHSLVLTGELSMCAFGATQGIHSFLCYFFQYFCL